MLTMVYMLAWIIEDLIVCAPVIALFCLAALLIICATARPPPE